MLIFENISGILVLKENKEKTKFSSFSSERSGVFRLERFFVSFFNILRWVGGTWCDGRKTRVLQLFKVDSSAVWPLAVFAIPHTLPCVGWT